MAEKIAKANVGLIPTSVHDLDLILAARVVTHGEKQCCCMCQNFFPVTVTGYHRLGSLLPFCGQPCIIKARNMANAMEQVQLIAGVDYAYIR